MNCAECKDLLVLYIEQVVDDSQKQTVGEHLSRCPSCRKDLEGLQTLQGRLVQNGKAVGRTSVEDEVMNRIIREQNVRLKSAAQAGAGLRLRRFLMKSPMTRIAAAAVVVVACGIALAMLRGTGSVALAAVVARVEQMQAYLYRERGTTQDQTRGVSTSDATVLVSNEHGMKSDRTTVNAADGRQTRSVAYLLPQKKSIVIVNMTEKEYGRVELDDATLANTKIEHRDPREMLKRLVACECIELGTSVIDGVKAQGFETTDPAYLGGTAENLSARVWVAVDTGLPVRYELELELRNGLHISTMQDSYQWGIRVEAGEFEPDIPADFTANRMDGMQTPSYSEQGIIEALQIAADFTGRYPEKLDSPTLRGLVQEMTGAITGENGRPVVQQWREQVKNAGSKEAAMRAGQGYFMKLMTLTMFPRVLAAQGAEPIYHGDVVTPSDAALPLMRWKTADNEYRVIFGDLHAETVTAEELTTLEAALPK